MEIPKIANYLQLRANQIDDDIRHLNREFSKRKEQDTFRFKNGVYTLLQIKEILDNLGAEKALVKPLLDYYEDKLEDIY